MGGFQYNNEYLVGSVIYNYSDADFYFHVIKIDSNSNVDWKHEVNNNGDDNLRALAGTIDGGILLAGSSHNACQENSFNIVNKINNSGNIVWSLFLGQS